MCVQHVCVPICICMYLNRISRTLQRSPLEDCLGVSLVTEQLRTQAMVLLRVTTNALGTEAEVSCKKRALLLHSVCFRSPPALSVFPLSPGAVDFALQILTSVLLFCISCKTWH